MHIKKNILVTVFLLLFFFFFFFFLTFFYQIFSLFPIVKMNANYVEICRVSDLEADFQQVVLVQFF